jgi:nucleoside-diphosphate-sugar epimerase
MRVLIVGCGYVGLPLGKELVKQGHDVFGLRRSKAAEAELAAAGLKPITGDITRPDELAKLPGPFDWVVNTVSSTKGGVDEYQQVYLQGMRHLLEWLASGPVAKFVYTSSTSVYGQTDSSVVTEVSPTVPASATSRVLVEAENLLLDAAHARAFPAVILRAAGIYGPDRGHLFLQYLRGEARLTGSGERILNMIHRDDLILAIIAALQRGRAGAIYNVADDEPVAEIEFFRWLSEVLGKPMPPSISEEEKSGRKRGLTNKRVSNRRLQTELGVRLKYPTFRQGYAAEIARLNQAGQLNTNKSPGS